MSKTLVIEGVKLTKKHFPILYEWAAHNPEWLAETLRANAKQFGGTPVSAAQSLESDLAHDQACGGRLESDEERL